jgi:biotin carboxyl carrier protein
MPDDRNGVTATTARGAAARTERDHAAIARLADDLLPALAAKLDVTGLGEIEIREGDWTARVRKPAGAAKTTSASTVSATAPAASGQTVAAGTAGRQQATSHGRAAADERERRGTELAQDEIAAIVPIVATSPAVGIFQPRKDLAVGMRLRAGEKIGTVDVLGVREDVVVPVDGVVGVSLVDPGEAVEYGQELIRIERPENARGLDATGSDREAVAVLGEA